MLEGYIETLFGSGDEAGLVVVKTDGREVFRVSDVTHPMPVTQDALEHAFNGYTFMVVDTDGNEHILCGMLAAAAAKYVHGIESVRSGIRQDCKKGAVPTAAAARKRFADFTQVGGSTRAGGAKRAMLTADDFAALVAKHDGDWKAAAAEAAAAGLM